MSLAREESLGQELRRVRKALGMTQGEAAKYCGVSLQSISLWERDQRQFNSLEQSRLMRQSLAKLKRRRRWKDVKR